MKNLRLIVLLFPALALLLAQSGISKPGNGRLHGIPFYQIYEEKDIENSSHAYFITTAPDGSLFFSSESGLHTFDGTSWKLVYESPASAQKIRSMIWTEKGVFAGGYGTIGRLNFKNKSGIQYEPINDAPLTDFASEFYSTVHRNGNEICFVGQQSVAIYNLETQKIRSTSFNSWVKGSIVSNGKLHIATIKDGLLRFDGSIFTANPAFAGFTDKHVITKFETNERGETYFATDNDEIYHIDAGQPLETYKPFPFQPGGTIRDIQFVGENKVALSIAQKGIYFMDREGHTIYSLEKNIDYRWAGASALHLDKYNTLWVQFNSTVGKVILDNPLTQIDDRLTAGVDYPSAYESNGQVYLQTWGKLLTPDFNQDGILQGFINAVPHLDHSISAVCPAADGLYVQAGLYTYFLANGETSRLGKTDRIDRMLTFENDPNKIFAATSTSLLVLQRNGNKIEIIAKHPQSAGYINKLARAKGDVFWIELGFGQIGRAWLENETLHYKCYTKENGLSTDWIALWENGDEVLFSSSEGISKFVPETQQFEKSPILDNYLPPDGIFHRLATDPDGNIWASYQNFNYILWKQAGGSYQKDSHSLRLAGDQYFNQFKFLSNGDALLLTATELYHIDGSTTHPPESPPPSNLHLYEISDTEGSTIDYLNSGLDMPPSVLDLAKNRRSLSIRVGDPTSSVIKAPQYQYLLDGLSKDWSKWSTANEARFTKLDSGDYTLHVRSRPNEYAATSEITLPFSIAPMFWETPLAYLGYLSALIVLLTMGYNLLSAKLKRTNEKLEGMVAERTKEIESKNRELQLNANELIDTLDELRSAQDLLINASRKAGMAEVATNVLHNVGNVLNSINVAILSLSERLSQERVSKLARVSELINKHEHDLAEFLTNDPKGKAIPAYLTQLSNVLGDDYSYYRVEVECMQENIEHVKKIIATQQTHAKTIEVIQSFKIAQLIEDALEMTTGDLEHSLFEIVRDFEPNLVMESDKHALLQMITNFIKNAKESIVESQKPLGLITISTRSDSKNKTVCIQISDNGIGVSETNSKKIFTHGFTTKTNGHGFGMHSCAIAAKSLGGDLQIRSEGPNTGATIIITLPLSQKARSER